MSDTFSSDAIPSTPSPLGVERCSAGPTNNFVAFAKEEIEQSIPERFQQQASKYPERIAVKGRKHTITYEALNRYANRIARAILALQGPGERTIALLLEKDAPMMAALLGALKAGKIYVALDPTQPAERAAKMLADAQANLIITDEENLDAANELSGQTRKYLNIAEIDSHLPEENLSIPISPDSLAYIIYTSGSTGEPKGVVQNHRNVLHNISRHTNSLHLTVDDRLTLLASCSTGQAVTDIFGALLNGATLCPFGIKEEGLARLSRWLCDEEISIYHSSASIFRYLLDALNGDESYPKIRLIKLGSEQVFKRDVDRYQKRFSPNCILVNALSSSEAGTLRQMYIDKQTVLHQSVVPVGFPADGMEILLLDDAGQQVEFNSPGEIVIKSNYLVPGYWRRPDLTSEVFHADPLGSKARVFHTGDMGRMAPNGCLEYLGRKDFQVKIRGFRVEIAEVEAALMVGEEVKQVAVTVKKDARGEKSLIAYVVPAAKARPSISDLRSSLRKKLPEHMIPLEFVLLEALPLTPSGKLDRKVLDSTAPLQPAHDAINGLPEIPLEWEIVRIWEELLGVRPIGTQDDFFALGGHSLVAVRMLDRIEEVCGTKLPLTTLLAGATVKHLAKSVLSANRKKFQSPLVAVQTKGTATPFFFLHGDFNGGGFFCRNLARLIGNEQPFYALAPHGLDGKRVPYSIEAMAAERLRTLLEVRPEGPYLLGGHCNGGLVALEMARLLRARGARVDLLVIIDATAANIHYRWLRRMMSWFGSVFGLDAERQVDWFKKLRRFYLRLRKSVRNEPHAVPEYVPSARQLEYRAAIEGYVPEPYDGSVALFRSRSMESRAPGDPTASWAQVATDVDVHWIPGEHLTCLTEHVDALAEHLGACLRRANCHSGDSDPVAAKSRKGGV